MTDLIQIAKEGDGDALKKAIDSGIDINITDSDGNCSIAAAAEAGHLEIVQQLIAADADVDLADKEGWTALMAAAGTG
ncbi:MAG: ankyrin repeat domain-containing protein, partial [Geitlerinemataceae cyanobacterium]